MITIIVSTVMYFSIGVVHYSPATTTGEVHKLTWFIHTKLHMMFFVLLLLDIIHCAIGRNQALLETIEALHLNVSAKCYELEYFAYVYGILIFGIFTYLLTIAGLLVHGLDNNTSGRSPIYIPAAG